MSILATLLRQKRIERAERRRTLAESWSRCEACEREVLAARHAHHDAQTTLVRMLSESDLCVQRLQLGHVNEHAMQRALDSAAQAHTALVAEVDRARSELTRTEREIDKLEERIADARHELELQRSHHSMHELEDWVLATRERVT